MTQTSDDSANNPSSTTSSTVIMGHDKGGKGSDTSLSSKEDQSSDTEEKVKEANASSSKENPVEETDAADLVAAVIQTSSAPESSTTSISLAASGEKCGEMDMSTDTSSLSFSTKAPVCAICSEPCICHCKSCKRVSYCSKEHQRRHWKQHRPECYPVTVQVNSVFGSHLVVTRDVKRGEVILREKPVVRGPFLVANHRYSVEHQTPSSSVGVCLTCHKIVPEDESSSCSKCGWPVCTSLCEQNPTHAAQECKMFAEYHLLPSALCDKEAQYLCVAFLRVLLHKTGDPPKWTQFMDVVNKQAPMKDGLNAQLEAKKSTARFSDLIIKSLGSIIHDKFAVTNVEIDQIVQTLRTTAFFTDNQENYINCFGSRSNCNLGHGLTPANPSRCNGKTVSVYHLASMLTSNCIPNASWVIQETQDFYLRASTPIKTGERISISYVDPLLGTWDRRKELWKEKYLSCTCSRCADPTELGTYFTAFRCSAASVEEKREGESTGVMHECEGYVLLQDPLAVSYPSWEEVKQRGAMEDDVVSPGEKLCEERQAGEWKCNACLMRQAPGFVERTLEKMRIISQDDDICLVKRSNDVVGRSDADNDDCDGEGNQPEARNQHGKGDRPSRNVTIDLQMLQRRVNSLDCIARNLTHVNHYSVVKMEDELLTHISQLFEKGQVPINEMEKWAVKMVEFCTKGLKVVNIICPGLSRPRGRLLYFLQQGLAISLLFKTSRAMRHVNGTATSDNLEVTQDELLKKFQELLLARKEVLEVFAIEREGSEEKAMLKAVQQDSIEIRVLKNHFKYHQNISRYI